MAGWQHRVNSLNGRAYCSGWRTGYSTFLFFVDTSEIPHAITSKWYICGPWGTSMLESDAVLSPSRTWRNKFADRNIPLEIERDGRECFLPPIRLSLYHRNSRWSLVSRTRAGTEAPPPCPRWVSRLRRRSRPGGVKHKTEVISDTKPTRLWVYMVSIHANRSWIFNQLDKSYGWSTVILGRPRSCRNMAVDVSHPFIFLVIYLLSNNIFELY